MLDAPENNARQSTLTKKIWLYSSPILAIVLIYAAWTLFTRWQENADLNEKAAQAASAKEREAAEKTIETLGGNKFDILSFYVSPGEIQRGEDAQLCYGVSNTKTVTLDPPIAEMWPSATRCINISPKKTTNYTLTAADAQGNKKSLSVELKVH